MAGEACSVRAFVTALRADIADILNQASVTDPQLPPADLDKYIYKPFPFDTTSLKHDDRKMLDDTGVEIWNKCNSALMPDAERFSPAPLPGAGRARSDDNILPKDPASDMGGDQHRTEEVKPSTPISLPGTMRLCKAQVIAFLLLEGAMGEESDGIGT
ncbi:hypothetical protein FQN49_002111 [Arthroderma sp. PD_2]|nr:hypothetical protein FQN49_002111 [Arthroderma sp. PD_2]